jgi:hypothetical protein
LLKISPTLSEADRAEPNKQFSIQPPEQLCHFSFRSDSFAKGFPTMVSRNQVHESLLRHGRDLTAEQHRRILDGLEAEGIISGQGGVVRAASTGHRHLLSPLRCAAAAKDEDTRRLLGSVQRRCKRAGFDLDYQSDAVISPVALDSALRASGLDPEERIALKSSLAHLGMIA